MPYCPKCGSKTIKRPKTIKQCPRHGPIDQHRNTSMSDDYLHDCVGGHPQCTTNQRATADCPHCTHRKMGSMDAIIQGKDFDHNRQRRDPHDYKTGLSDVERQTVEQMAFNFHAHFGKPMRVPPSLYADLRAGGVDMSHIQADDRLETRGLTSQ